MFVCVFKMFIIVIFYYVGINKFICIFCVFEIIKFKNNFYKMFSLNLYFLFYIN